MCLGPVGLVFKFKFRLSRSGAEPGALSDQLLGAGAVNSQSHVLRGAVAVTSQSELYRRGKAWEEERKLSDYFLSFLGDNAPSKESSVGSSLRVLDILGQGWSALSYRPVSWPVHLAADCCGQVIFQI